VALRLVVDSRLKSWTTHQALPLPSAPYAAVVPTSTSVIDYLDMTCTSSTCAVDLTTYIINQQDSVCFLNEMEEPPPPKEDTDLGQSRLLLRPA